MDNKDSLVILSNNELEKQLIEICHDAFYSITGLSPLPIQIEIVDNIFERRMQLTPYYKSQEVIDAKSVIDEQSGTLVVDNSIDSIQHILVKNDTFQPPNFMIFDVIPHELTHLHDFHEFANKVGICYYQQLDRSALFNSFFHWTEFHAKRIGYAIFRELIYLFNKANLSVDEQLSFIKDTEMPLQTERLISRTSQLSVNDRFQLGYLLVHYMGRFSVWNDLFPTEFNYNTIPLVLIDKFGKGFTGLYSYLLEHKDNMDIENEDFRFCELLSAIDNKK